MSEETRVLPGVEMNEELSKAIAGAINPEDIKAAILAEAEKQSDVAAQLAADQAKAEKDAADKLAAEQAAAAAVTVPTNFTRKETIGGKEFTFEAGSELELERQISNAFRIAASIQVPQETPAPAIDPAVAQKAAEDREAARAALELQFRTGEISAADYIEKSGAMSEYLEKQGVPLSKLKEVVEQNQTAGFAKSWEQATAEFLSKSDWPGGEKNKELLGLKLAQLGLVDAEDKVGALAQAYADLKSRDLLFPGETPAAPTTAPVVSTTAPVVPAVVPPVPVVVTTAPTSSSLFGQSSGTSGGGSDVAPVVPVTKPVVDANATPAEIMGAWKKAQLASGKNPDDAFKEAFSARHN